MNHLKKQTAQMNLVKIPSTIIEETTQFDESLQYFLVTSPEIKRTIENKLTSTVLDTSFRFSLDDEEHEIDQVSVSQITISTPPRRIIECASFVDRDCSLLCFENPLCDSLIEEETIEEETFGRVNSGVINLPNSNTELYIESYGFSSNQFQTANTRLFTINEETNQDEIFV